MEAPTEGDDAYSEKCISLINNYVRGEFLETPQSLMTLCAT